MSIQQHLHDLVQELWIAPKEQTMRSYDELDPKIAPLVQALNQFDDVVTVASCQGHAAGRQEAPYVYFHAPLPFVQQLVTEIRQAHLDDRFHHAWKIRGFAPISAESPDLALRLCLIRSSGFMTLNISDTIG